MGRASFFWAGQPNLPNPHKTTLSHPSWSELIREPNILPDKARIEQSRARRRSS